MDSESYMRILKLLNENLNFNLKIIHTDYQITLGKTINKCNYFEVKPIHVKYLFYFLKGICEKLKKLLLIKKVWIKKI